MSTYLFCKLPMVSRLVAPRLPHHFRSNSQGRKAALQPIVTRFRTYQLGCAGSSFSYFADGRFTLIEARLNDTSARSVANEMAICGVETADCLHITSWDTDHCSPSELPVLLMTLRPAKIQCPGYEPSSDSGKN